MDTPIFSAADPLVIPAKVYDRVWVEEVIIYAPDPNGDASARVKLRRFTVVDGVAELEPDAGTWLSVPNVLATAANDPDLAQAVSSLMAYIAKTGRAQGVIAAGA
jgi:hypothetical protein